MEYVYYILHKPAGYVSAVKDNLYPTVLALIDNPQGFQLFPVGRLDLDTEGLLLITNDGTLAHELLSPKKHVEKTYYARIDGKITEEDLKYAGITEKDLINQLKGKGVKADDVMLATINLKKQLTIFNK